MLGESPEATDGYEQLKSPRIKGLMD